MVYIAINHRLESSVYGTDLEESNAMAPTDGCYRWESLDAWAAREEAVSLSRVWR